MFNLPVDHGLRSITGLTLLVRQLYRVAALALIQLFFMQCFSSKQGMDFCKSPCAVEGARLLMVKERPSCWLGMFVLPYLFCLWTRFLPGEMVLVVQGEGGIAAISFRVSFPGII